MSAQVTAPVFDSITGEHLLIPQGSRLIGRYDNAVRYGDRRLFLVWTRLILPNGWSINLEEMAATDPSARKYLPDFVGNVALHLPPSLFIFTWRHFHCCIRIAAIRCNALQRSRQSAT